MTKWHSLPDILDALYEVCENGGSWARPLDLVADATGSCAAVYQHFDRRTDAVVEMETRNLSDERVAEYQARYAFIDPRVAYAKRCRRRMVIADSAFTTEREMGRSEYYEDFLAPQGLRYFGAAILDVQPETLAAFGVQRRSVEGHAEPDDLKLLDVLRPHVERVARLRRLDLYREGLLTAAEDAIESARRGIALVAGSGHAVLVNAEIRRIVERGDGLRLEGGYLVASHAGDRARLSSAIAGAGAIANGAIRAGGRQTLRLRRPYWPEPLIVVVLPAGRRGHRCRSAVVPPLALLSVSRPERRGRPDLALIAEAFDLTPQEARIAQGLAAGADLPTIADRLGITGNTLRGYLKVIYSKTLTHRQADLVSKILALGFPDDLRSTGPARGGPGDGRREDGAAASQASGRHPVRAGGRR